MRRRKKRRIFRKLLGLILCGLLILGGFWLYRTKKQVDEVKKWQTEVAAATQRYGIPEDTDIVLAIILTETKGQHIDLMQSSESRYGSQAEIVTSEESIDAGVAFFAEAVTKATAQNCDLWTAVQAYNFGLAYIDYVAKNGGTNTVELAEKYSKETLAPTLGNTAATTYEYYGIPALLKNKCYLYTNGGNFFYGELVRLNLRFIKYL